MTQTNPVIRPIRKNDVIAYRGKMYNESFRGLAVELDGEVIGIAGVLHTPVLQAFSMIKDEMRKYPKSLVKAAQYFRTILAEYDSPVYAKPSPDEKNPERYLEYVGFKRFNGSLYEWTQ